MPKYNYKTLDEIPENVMDFYDANQDVNDYDPGCVDLISVKDINDFLNDLNSWYESQQMDIEDFING